MMEKLFHELRYVVVAVLYGILHAAMYEHVRDITLCSKVWPNVDFVISVWFLVQFRNWCPRRSGQSLLVIPGGAGKASSWSQEERATSPRGPGEADKAPHLSPMLKILRAYFQNDGEKWLHKLGLGFRVCVLLFISQVLGFKVYGFMY